jgi:hypothetical protein
MLSTITLILCQLSDEWRVLESECSQLWVTQTNVWTTLCQLSDEWSVLESEWSQLWVTDKSMDNPLSVE